jgi:anti-anti-sigma factor
MAAAEQADATRSVTTRLGTTMGAHGTTTTIALAGEWDLAEQTATRQATQNALRRSPECLVLDLSQLTFIDSSGIQVVLELQKCSTEQGFRFVIVPGPPAVQRPFEILGLTGLLPFLPAANPPWRR